MSKKKFINPVGIMVRIERWAYDRIAQEARLSNDSYQFHWRKAIEDYASKLPLTEKQKQGVKK